MILGIGIDIIEVERIAEKLQKNDHFIEKVFSTSEIQYCRSCADSMQHYAVRFSAKEAFLKATGFGLQLGFELHEIEIIHDALGRPLIQLQGKFKEQAKLNNWSKIHLSISHIRTMACAVVIIES